MSHDRGLVSPEAVLLDLPEATVGSRGAAVMCDWIIMGVTLFALSAATNAAAGATWLPSWVIVTAGLVLPFLVFFGYPIVFETTWRGGGRTPGKALLGLRVVTVEGAPIRFRHAAIRAALGLIDFAATFGLAAVLSSLLSKRNQRLGDFVAGTVVLRERMAAGPSAARDFTVPPEAAATADALDTSGLDARDYAAVRTYLLRADTLPADRRREIGEHLLRALEPRLSGAPSDLAPEVVLQAVAARYQQRRRAGGLSSAS